MNYKKISFISCVNDEITYNECLKYINSLRIPEGYEIETIAITGANSITSGYNEAMKKSDAKYKIYLHQDVFIVNKNFLNDILKVFSKDENIGMIGLAGAKIIPTNGVWWDSFQKYGKAYENHNGTMNILKFNDFSSDYEEVKAIDGMIICTQKDVLWRDDIFTGWHFYDISQCVEFDLRGYKIVIPNQNEPWIIHDCGLIKIENSYEKYKNVFLNEYSKKIFPLVSILIPTHNRPEYFEIALNSAINQTYKNIEIIVSDDSSNDLTQKIIEAYLKRYDFIKYYRAPMEYDGLQNMRNCYKYANGEYINYLMDDDTFDKCKLEKMINYFLNFNNISIVTSYRNTIDENGNILPDSIGFSKLYKKDTLVNGKRLAEYMLTKTCNFIGEPTTAMFRKKDIGIFGKLLGRNTNFCVDLATWLELLNKGDCIYISEPLSSFRRSSKQGSNDINILAYGIFEWVYFIKDAYENNMFLNKENLICALTSWMYRTNMNFIYYCKHKNKIKDINKIKSFDLEFRNCFDYVNNKLKDMCR